MIAIAERRMFSQKIIDSDLFLDMPLSSQSLYFHLSMRADDEGFINNPKKIQRMIGCSDDDFKLLIAKEFVIPFQSGIVVIRHWKIHNYIRGDRKKETLHQDELAHLTETESGEYILLGRLMADICPSSGSQDDGQVSVKCQHRLGKVSIGKDSIDKEIYSDYVQLTQAEYEKLLDKLTEKEREDYIERLNNYIGQIGVKEAKKKYKSHYHVILNWYRKDHPKQVEATQHVEDNPFMNRG